VPATYTLPLLWRCAQCVPCEPLTKGSRATSVDSDEVYRKRAQLETAFPKSVIIHPKHLLYIRLSIQKGEGLVALSENRCKSGRPRGFEKEWATLPRLRKEREDKLRLLAHEA
jgi:hypothetical protein